MTSWFDRPVTIRITMRADALTYYDEAIAHVAERLRLARSRRAKQRLADRLARLQRGAEAAGAL